MKYIDRIYGEVEIVDLVALDIISDSAIQRLKGVDQAGYFDVYFPGTKHSRFEHSLGCYILLKRFNASVEEQLAGLIHDISHSAFSHTADYVFESGRGADQNYQDDIFVDFVRKTNIPNILEKHGFSVEYILDECNFPLQETDLPNLCVDRIDYSLRGAAVYGEVTVDEVDEILRHLRVIDNKWVFNDYDIAYKYAHLFKKLNDVYYSGKETAAMFFRTSQWIKHAVKKGYITREDLFMTDEKVINCINTNLKNDNKLQDLWNIMNDPKIVVRRSIDNGVSRVDVKSRIIDPLFICEKRIKKLSSENIGWRDVLYADIKTKIYYL